MTKQVRQTPRHHERRRRSASPIHIVERLTAAEGAQSLLWPSLLRRLACLRSAACRWTARAKVGEVDPGRQPDEIEK